MICPICKNLIDSSNRSLLCGECGAQLCQICESWFREERKRGERPLCKKCFIAEQERMEKHREEEGIKKEKEEQESERNKREAEARLKQEMEELRRWKEEEKKKEKEAMIRKALEEQERKRREQEEKARKESKEQERLKKLREEEEKRKLTNSIGFEFVKISAGDFMMGSNELDREKPIHKVSIREPFYLGKYPVTQKQWKAVMGNNPSFFKGDDLPVENVSWNNVQEFIRKLNQMEKTDEYHLPSEAEWEYACRAGTTTRYSFGDDESKLGDYAWFDDNSDRKTHPVGLKKPNSWGLYDMHGNIWEWCQDNWHENYNSAPSDGSAWESGNSSFRVDRGGGWYFNTEFCRSAYHYGVDPSIRHYGLGFRILRKQ